MTSRPSRSIGTKSHDKSCGPLLADRPYLERAIARVGEIKALGLAGVGLDGVVAQRRVVDLARYGMTANARTLRRHPRSRRLATLLATVVALEAKATDDCLELLDLLMVTELLGLDQPRTAGLNAARERELLSALRTGRVDGARPSGDKH